ncbi:Hypothetical protein PHPALM_4391 [Phytophthora palmivora]|uniref:Uncharacterized protein n=1 Tax=Phytophthora palmivora TaxID=4796 RepID=A0A2P4YK09_9STRA|nr:Hypothetical protein PHPALM_4391 [Phytophthora palmivora]
MVTLLKYTMLRLLNTIDHSLLARDETDKVRNHYRALKESNEVTKALQDYTLPLMGDRHAFERYRTQNEESLSFLALAFKKAP